VDRRLPRRPPPPRGRRPADEHRGDLHPPSRHDDPRHARDPDVRDHGLSAAPGERSSERRLPDHLRQRQPARRESRDDGLGGGHTARAPVHHDRRARLDDFDERPGDDRDHAHVRPEPPAGRRRPGRPVGHRQGRLPASQGHAEPADVPEGQPCGPADPLSGAHIPDTPAVRPGRVRRDEPGPAHLHGERRGAGQRDRGAEVRGPHPARSARPGDARHRHRRGLAGGPGPERELADRDALRRAQGVHRAGQRSADGGRGLPASRRGLPERLPRAAPGARPCHRQRRERQDRRLVRNPDFYGPGHHPVDPAPAGNEHRRDRPRRSTTSSSRCS